MNKIKLLVIWFIGSFVASIIVSFITILLWQLLYEPTPDVNWRPIHDVVNTLKFIPIGLVSAIFAPWGWLSVIGLIISLHKTSIKPLYISLVGVIMFGAFWPFQYQAMIGV